jgi:glycine cleavage system H lipoate-binding protein
MRDTKKANPEVINEAIYGPKWRLKINKGNRISQLRTASISSSSDSDSMG